MQREEGIFFLHHFKWTSLTSVSSTNQTEQHASSDKAYSKPCWLAGNAMVTGCFRHKMTWIHSSMFIKENCWIINNYHNGNQFDTGILPAGSWLALRLSFYLTYELNCVSRWMAKMTRVIQVLLFSILIVKPTNCRLKHLLWTCFIWFLRFFLPSLVVFSL